MFNFQNNELLNDLPSETESESKYLTKFFLSFTLAYFLVYVLINIFASYVSALDCSKKTMNIIGMGISQLVMPLIFVITKVFTRNLQSAKHPVMDCMTVKKFIKILIVSVFILAVGSVMSSYVIAIVSKLRGAVPENYVAQSVTEMSIPEIFIFVVVVAPIFEELVFRKLMIDTFSKYGTSFSVAVSAFLFGLVHGNFYQFFYAFGLGALMGYVYCIYGKVIYTILIHAAINALGSIVPIAVGISQSQTVTTAQTVYVFCYMVLAVCGGFIIFNNYKKLRFYKIGGILISPSKSLYKSWGFVICAVTFTIKFIYYTI